MNYESMSDMEVNKAIANSLRVYWSLSPDRGGSNRWEFCDYYGQIDRYVGEYEEALPDYCNNPADMWPIIVDNGITVDGNGGAWVHEDSVESWHYEDNIHTNVAHNNPLRAAAIVFLMMQEDK